MDKREDLSKNLKTQSLPDIRNFTFKPKKALNHAETTTKFGARSAIIISSDSDSDVVLNETVDGCCDLRSVAKGPVCNVDDSENDENDYVIKDECPKNSEVNSDEKPVSTFDTVVISDDERCVTNGVTVNNNKRKLLKKKNDKKRKRKKKQTDSGTDSDNYENVNVYNSDEESDEDTSVSSVIQKKREHIVTLLNEGTKEDFALFPSLTPKKIDLIISCRPFADWNDLVNKFNFTRGLNATLTNAIAKILLAQDVMCNLMKKCEKMAEKTQKFIASKGMIVSKQPSILNDELQLAAYQLVGLNWLAVMDNQSLNSILADEMGLGKTVQVIAFLAYLKEIDHFVQEIPHLIVVPASTLDNWKAEFARWCPSLKISIYHGNQDERKFLRYTWVKHGFGDTDVVLTSYSCVTKSYEEKKLFRFKEFHYIVFDEAHRLKNMNCSQYEALLQFNGNYKILLTGTPLQNNLLELISLLNFLMPAVFETKKSYLKLLFSKSSFRGADPKFEQEKIEQAKKIMEPFMLRRLKMNVLTDLPKKTAHLVQCQLQSHQKQKYAELLEEFKNAILGSENVQMIYLMKLRKLSNHPLMLRYIFTEDKLRIMADRLSKDDGYKDTVVEYILDDLYFKSDYELHTMCQTYTSLQNLKYDLPAEEFCKSGKLEKITSLLNELKADGHRVLIFSQFIMMLDILEEYMKINNHMYLRLDGSTPVTERQTLINLFNTQDNIFVFLLSTKAGGLGINLTAADTIFIHDIDFNPYNDKQAEDRCHRVGQTRPVQVFRFISKGTVEEKIYEIAQKKLELEKEVISNDDDDAKESNTVIQLIKESLGLHQVTSIN